MESNLLLEQYSRYKKHSLEESPYRCLLNTNIELNPHQINAFVAAIKALKTGGIVLADEVGLGKTIEAGLVLKYVLDSGAKKVLIALPAALRKQWEVELSEKFGLEAVILDRLSVDKDYYDIKHALEKRDRTSIVITSYDFSSKLMKRFPKVKWDFLIIDEAHNLRNVFHGTKRAKNLYDVTKGIPKILLTATPLQNSLSDLHGLISFIDPRIFGSTKVFEDRFVKGQEYDELKKELSPVLYRTLRRDVNKYMDFKKRTCVTVDFHLTQEEAELYYLVNSFLKRETLHSIPSSNRQLVVLVIRKLLASSSFALVQTFEVLKNRLEKLYEGTKSANAQEGFELFWDFVEDEIDEEDIRISVVEDEDIANRKKEIKEEIDIVKEILEVANSVKLNAKLDALKTALNIGFGQQQEMGIPEKAVVFTESKRTQKYIASELRKQGYSDDDILLFNGDFDDKMSKDIFRAWRAKNYGETDYGRNVEFKHAIVDYFKDHSKILIVTDAGSEGLNLQFCNTVINYDLPWNPQKIEQRIGRCHRYGQKNNVVAINLLNTDNEADKRVYEILSKKFELFEGVFGASDIALGVLESGTSFEKRILDIYQKCDTDIEFQKEFEKLNKKLTAKSDKNIKQLQSILLTESSESKGEALDKTKAAINNYLDELEYWGRFAEPEMDSNMYYWKIENWGEKNFGSHGTLFIGAFCNNLNLLFPVLLLCDENGEYIDFDEKDIVKALETADDGDIRFFTPTDKEREMYDEIYDRLTQEMLDKYNQSVRPLMEYNEEKIRNWKLVQIDQLRIQISETEREIESLLIEENHARDALQKKDIMKKIVEKQKQHDKLVNGIDSVVEKIKTNAQEEIAEFNKQFDIRPLLLVNIVLKF